MLGFEGEILALEAKLKELNEKEAEFTDAIKQQEGKIESVKMEFAPQQNALDKRQEEIEEREKTIQQEYVSNETPILGVCWAALRNVYSYFHTEKWIEIEKQITLQGDILFATGSPIKRRLLRL